jgi:hypothetical protein
MYNLTQYQTIASHLHSTLYVCAYPYLHNITFFSIRGHVVSIEKKNSADDLGVYNSYSHEESNEDISMSLNPLDEKENTNVAPDSDRTDTGNGNAGIAG